MILRRIPSRPAWYRAFSTSRPSGEVLDVRNLPNKIIPKYLETPRNDLLSLLWPSPPQNIFIVKKDGASKITDNLVEYVKHIHANYNNISLIFEAKVAAETHELFNFPIYTTESLNLFSTKVDLVTTLGGDGTILHASSLFNTTSHVPPILSFSMGTLGFLGEWKFDEYKRAFREVYMSGAAAGSPLLQGQSHAQIQAPDEKIMTGWSGVRGKSMGPTRSSKILLRNRVQVGVFDEEGNRVTRFNQAIGEKEDVCAMNEVVIHRGKETHLVIIEVFVGGRFLTEAVADGIIIATPTGSTAYSLSSGGSIVHPLVSSILMTPICPRSLSFRPLVLPANTPITLRLSKKNRGRELAVTIDGQVKVKGIGVGMEIRVCANDIIRGHDWTGGVPCVMRGTRSGVDNNDDGWVGGLNGLLKFNYPFGEAL
ncbi:Bgt-3474 [Blumeria graminis f. sp. tritici]|uniref:Mitochondrial NADH kinase n=3 Tax=Blumeria graminis f. sp. tritici TaxID=62690 RepID=A0A656KG49_BLUGR|nr:Mitochondrial NADH kinase [Blumeria graminis f. sp. tritici 96224]VDB91335.1 Bgt-3474 [Blumeria graminis f. sp. tritici]